MMHGIRIFELLFSCGVMDLVFRSTISIYKLLISIVESVHTCLHAFMFTKPSQSNFAHTLDVLRQPTERSLSNIRIACARSYLGSYDDRLSKLL